MIALLFARGFGRGHVVSGLAIAREFSRLRNDVDIQFISYSTGAEMLKELGRPHVDLNLPASTPPLETLIRVTRVIGNLAPNLVIGYEEFSAMPAAKVFDLPTLFLTDVFAPSDKLSMQSLAYADEVIFTGDPGLFDEPDQVRGRVHYVGPVYRELPFTRSDRKKARDELGLDHDALVITVAPGSCTESQAPIFDQVVSAVDKLPHKTKSLLWIAGDDYESLCRRANNSEILTIIRSERQLDRLMAASDLVITKATRVTCRELAALGVPSISLSHGLNPPDDKVVSQIASNLFLDAKAISSHQLSDAITAKLAESAESPPAPLAIDRNGSIGAAQCISRFADQFMAAKSQPT